MLETISRLAVHRLHRFQWYIETVAKMGETGGLYIPNARLFLLEKGRLARCALPTK